MLTRLINFIEIYHFNILNFIFIGFTIVIVLFGSLITLVEQHLPNCIRQSFRYGKHKHQGPDNALVKFIEVPKAWFKHFYILAFSGSLLTLSLLLKGFIFKSTAPEYVLEFLDFIAGGKSRKVQVDSSCALVASVLMTMQCGRRFYETNFLQIFSKKSRMNLSHYLVGHIHYIGALLALLANTEGFVRETIPSSFSLNKLSLLQCLCIFIFHFSWSQQYKANMILVNLRKDPKTDRVITEAHLMPQGGFFQLISSPHMFFELVMYVAVSALLPESTTWCLIVLWVVSNQVINALLTHRWYKEQFKNYPPQRKAIIPFVL